jgi:hypothetical protein
VPCARSTSRRRAVASRTSAMLSRRRRAGGPLTTGTPTEIGRARMPSLRVNAHTYRRRAEEEASQGGDSTSVECGALDDPPVRGQGRRVIENQNWNRARSMTYLQGRCSYRRRWSAAFPTPPPLPGVVVHGGSQHLHRPRGRHGQVGAWPGGSGGGGGGGGGVAPQQAHHPHVPWPYTLYFSHLVARPGRRMQRVWTGILTKH